MSVDKKDAVIREIWNARFRIHSLRPLQSVVKRVNQDLNSVTKFYIDHRILPMPIPAEFYTGTEQTSRRRELKHKLISLKEIMQLQQIRALTVSSHLPIEQAIIERLRQHDIFITDLKVTLLNAQKQLYELEVLKSPFVNTIDTAKINVKLVDESLLATDFLDGSYQSKISLMNLNVTPYSVDQKIRYGSLVAWKRHSSKLKLTPTIKVSLRLYSVEDSVQTYDEHQKLIGTEPTVQLIDIEAGTQIELQFLENETILKKDSETIHLPAVGDRIACFFYTNSVSPERISVELSSLEQV